MNFSNSPRIKVLMLATALSLSSAWIERSFAQLLVKNSTNEQLIIVTKDGNVGVGTMATPGARLEVAGQVKITGGAPAAGKILTSNADGLASWEPAPAFPGDNLGNHTATSTLQMQGHPIQFGNWNGQKVNFYGAGYAIGIQPSSIFFRTSGNFAFYNNGSFVNNVWDPGSGGNLLLAMDGSGRYGFNRSTNANCTIDVAGLGQQNSYSVPDAAVVELRLLSGNNRVDDGAILVLGGNFGGTGYIKTNAKSGSAGDLVIGNRRTSSATTMEPGIVLNTAGHVGLGAMSPRYRLDAATTGVNSQIHFSNDVSSDVGGYLTSSLPTQFVLSGGCAYNDNTGSQMTAKASEAVSIGAYMGNFYTFTQKGLTVGQPFEPNFRMVVGATGNVYIGDIPINPGWLNFQPAVNTAPKLMVFNDNGRSQIQFRQGWAGASGGGGGYLTSNHASQFIISGGAQNNGSAWVAESSDPSMISSYNGTIYFHIDHGVSNAYTPTVRMSLSASGSEATLTVNGDIYAGDNVSAASFTDRTPYPKDVKTAYDAVFSMERLPDGLYQENNKDQQLDHARLHPYLKAGDNERDLSATVSAQNEVIKDLVKQVNELKAALQRTAFR